MISAAGKNLRWPVALETLRHMRFLHLEPTVSSFNAATSAYALALEWQMALDALRSIR